MKLRVEFGSAKEMPLLHLSNNCIHRQQFHEKGDKSIHIYFSYFILTDVKCLGTKKRRFVQE